jgi:hypothetical protein
LRQLEQHRCLQAELIGDTLRRQRPAAHDEGDDDEARDPGPPTATM